MVGPNGPGDWLQRPLEFESADSTILDVTLPSTGSYYIGVDSVLSDLGFATPASNYELFMYSFAGGILLEPASRGIHDSRRRYARCRGQGNDTPVGSGRRFVRSLSPPNTTASSVAAASTSKNVFIRRD